MNAAPQIPPTSDWEDLQESLAGSFTVRARSLFANDFVIRKGGSTVGHFIFDGLKGAEFTVGALESTLERAQDGKYALFSGGHRVLTAVPPTSSLEALEITCGDGVYRARISFLRNEARALSADDRETSRLEGNVTGGKYEITTDRADAAALPVAALLLYHTATFRRRAFLA